MSLTQQQYEQKVLRLAAERGRTLDIADIAESLGMALQTVSRQIANSPDYYLLQKVFTAPIVNGVADLSAATTMFRDTIERVEDNSDPVNTYSLLPPGASKSDLDEPRNLFSYHAVVERNTLYARGGDGSSVPPDATLSILANYSAIISEIPDPLYTDNLVESGFQLCLATST